MGLIDATEGNRETVEPRKSVGGALAGRRSTVSPQTKVEPDGKVTGLYKRTFLASGEARWIVAKRPAGSSKVVTVTLGRVEDFPIAKARNEARRIIGQLAQGVNPNALKREKRDAERAQQAEAKNTLLHVATAYLERGARQGLRPVTLHGYRRMLALPDLAAWHDRPINGITAREVEALVGRIRERGAPVQANRVFEFLAAVFKMAVRRDAIVASPIAKIDRKDVRHAERPRERSLVHPLTGDMSELLAVWRGVDRIEPEHHPVRALVKLLILTGVRVGVFTRSSPGQVQALTWSAVKDLDKPEHARLEIPAGLRKTGGRDGRVQVVPLAPQAVALLKGLAYVGPTAPIFTVDGKLPLPITGVLRDQLRALAQEAHGGSLAPWTPHDLRRSMRTGLAFLGCPGPIAEAILDHAVGGIEGVYNVAKQIGLQRTWLEKWADRIEQEARRA
jgi:integrase